MEKLVNILGYRVLMTLLLLLYGVVLASATFIENSYGTIVAKGYVYNNILFFLLQVLMVINFVSMSIRYRLFSQRKWGVLILHYGFVVVLLGAIVTHIFGIEGIVHVREGEKSNQLLDLNGRPFGSLPFSIGLDDFVLDTYSGSGSPSSFESFLTIDGHKHHAYMNNVVYVGSYRIYQSSYDSDLKGTVLTVNKDLIGTIITYLGYLMLVLGFVLSMFHKGSRFRRLSSGLGVLMLFVVLSSSAQDAVKKEDAKSKAISFVKEFAVSDTIADKFSHLMVQTIEGRIEPVDTYSRELLRKLNRQTSFADLSSNQVLLGLLSMPDAWSRVELIKVGNDAILKQLGAVNDHIAFVDVIDSTGAYIFDSEVNEVFSKSPSLRTKYDKELLKLDEKVNILNALFNGMMLNIFPLEGDPQDHWYSPNDDFSQFNSQDSMFVSRVMPWLIEELQAGSLSGNWAQSSQIIDMIDIYQTKKSNSSIASPSRIASELLYNRLDIFKWCGFGFMGLGLVLMIVLVISSVTGRRFKVLIYILLGFSVLMFLAQNFGMGLRWYISERAPWTNAYESMIYVGWAAILGGLIFVRRSKLVFSLAMFLGGAILFVSNLSFMDPQITPLVPVLKSYWLIVHVAVITASYGFFGLGFLIGLVTLLLMIIDSKRLSVQIKELVTINELGLWIGLSLMTLGTFLGAVWANESWGRYWGWDPKETWALITVIVYALILHIRLRSSLLGQWQFSVMSLLGLGSVLMTFFGVNYYLSGLHSYGSDSAPAALNFIWYTYGVLIPISIIAYLKIRKS